MQAQSHDAQEDWAIAQVVGIPGAEPTACEFESQTELPCFTTGFIPGFPGGPSDHAGAHAQTKISIYKV
jgi:hypothetical protein